MEIWGSGRRRIESLGQWRAASRRPAIDWLPHGPATALAKWALLDGAPLDGGPWQSGIVERPLLPAHFARSRAHDLLLFGATTLAVDGRSDTPFAHPTMEERLAADDGLETHVERLFSGPAATTAALNAEAVTLLISAVLAAAERKSAQTIFLFLAVRGPLVRQEPFGSNAVVVDQIVRHLSHNKVSLLDEGQAGPFDNRLGPPLTVIRRILTST